MGDGGGGGGGVYTSVTSRDRQCQNVQKHFRVKRAFPVSPRDLAPRRYGARWETDRARSVSTSLITTVQLCNSRLTARKSTGRHA